MTDPTIQEVLDHFAIRKVLERYCHACDRCNRDLLESCYWPGAGDDHGTYSGPAEGFIDFVMPVLKTAYDGTTHMIAQSTMRIDGDLAAVETYVLATHKLAGVTPSAINRVGGRYVDRFEKRGGEWRIADRTLLIDWTENQPDGTVPEGARALTLDVFRRGRRDGSDMATGMIYR